MERVIVIMLKLLKNLAKDLVLKYRVFRQKLLGENSLFL